MTELSKGSSPVNPRWWNDQMSSGWERSKEALRRDWEQTKSDVTGGQAGAPTGQVAKDTVRGKPTADWNSVESSVRYGYGAGAYYNTQKDWDERLEARLKEEWNDLKTGRTWEEIKASVRKGWDAARGRR